jgi:hypothetical protein
MYYKLDELETKMIKDASDLTRENYKINNELIEVEELLYIIETLMYEIDYQKEEYEALKQDLEDNYRPIPYHEQVGVYDSDFI